MGSICGSFPAVWEENSLEVETLGFRAKGIRGHVPLFEGTGS